MCRQWMMALSLSLVLTCGAWAFVGQEQGFGIGATNHLTWAGGVGQVEGGHQAMFGQEQTILNGWRGPSGTQKETGIFTQTASAGGGGPAIIGQTAVIGGVQEQGGTSLGGSTTTQGQGMGVQFTTTLIKPWGSGGASAAQAFVGGQTQTLMTPTTLSTESQVVGVTEYASIIGGPKADPTVQNSITVELGQGQTSTTPYWPCWPCR